MAHTISDIYGGYMTIDLAGTILAAANKCIPMLKLHRDALVYTNLHDDRIAVVCKALSHWEEMKLQYTAYLRKPATYKGLNSELHGDWTVIQVSSDGHYAQCANNNGTLKWVKLSNLTQRKNA